MGSEWGEPVRPHDDRSGCPLNSLMPLLAVFAVVCVAVGALW